MPTIVKNKNDILEYRLGNAGTVEIFDIVVRSERQRGVGRSMIQELIEKESPSTIYAFCRASNANAHHFYRKVGFREVDIGEFYEDGRAKLFIYETSK